MVCLFLSSAWSNPLNNHLFQGQQRVFSEHAAGLATLREHHPLRTRSPVGAGINLSRFSQHKDLPSAPWALWFAARSSNPCQSAFPGVPCPSSPAQSGARLGESGRWWRGVLTLLSWPLSPRLSLCDFETTLNHCAGEDVLDDGGGDVDEANEDASTEALYRVTQGLRSDGAWGQTGGDVILELRVTVILQPPPATSVRLSFRMLGDHFTSENPTEPQNFLLRIL